MFKQFTEFDSFLFCLEIKSLSFSIRKMTTRNLDAPRGRLTTETSRIHISVISHFFAHSMLFLLFSIMKLSNRKPSTGSKNSVDNERFTTGMLAENAELS